jgi:hypothetical protein
MDADEYVKKEPEMDGDEFSRKAIAADPKLEIEIDTPKPSPLVSRSHQDLVLNEPSANTIASPDAFSAHHKREHDH